MPGFFMSSIVQIKYFYFNKCVEIFYNRTQEFPYFYDEIFKYSTIFYETTCIANCFIAILFGV